MSRRHTFTQQAAEAAVATLPHVVCPHSVYTVQQAQAALGLRPSTIRRELREGRLRVAKRAGRYYLLGEWILEWLRGGEIRRRQPANNGTEI